MYPRTAALERQHALRHRARAAPDARPAAAAGASRKAEDEFRPFAHAALSLAIGQVARTRVRMQRIPAATPGRKRAANARA